MSNNQTYKDKLAALLESFSELTDHDLEAAKDVIRATGKDPDSIVEKGLKRLEQIKKIYYSSRKAAGLTSIPFLQKDDQTKKVFLSYKASGSDILDISAIYELEDNNDYTWDTGDLKIRELCAHLAFKIFIQASIATATSEIRQRNRCFSVDMSQVDNLMKAGYVIHDNMLFPLSEESVAAAGEIRSILSEDNTLSLRDTLHFFGARADNPFIAFEPEAFSISQITGSELYSGESDLFKGTLYPYQKEGLQWLQYCCINRIGGILGDDMGLGKTAQTIALIAWIMEKNLLDSILIVLPSTLMENWKREFAFFTPSIVPYIHHGALRTGSKFTLSKEKVVITSYSILMNDRYLFAQQTWGLLLMDEAGMVKNPDAERRKALAEIPAQVRIAMSGTPVENSLIDLWSLADLVNPGYLDTRQNFIRKYISKDLTSTLNNAALGELRDTVSRIMLRRKKEEVLDSLPERIDIHQVLQLNTPEATQYESQRQIVVSKLAGLTEANLSINILKQIQLMRQYTTHPFMKEPEKLATASFRALCDSSVKFARMAELLEEIKERKEKVLIFTEYRNMIDALKRTLSFHYNCKVYTIDGRVEIVQRQENIDIFTAEKGFSIMVLNPRTAGMGLNITAASHVIHYTRQWNPALEEQASARAYRNGQTKAVNIYYLYYADTIEEMIDNRLKEKKQLSGEVISNTDTGKDMAFYLRALEKSPFVNNKH